MTDTDWDTARCREAPDDLFFAPSRPNDPWPDPRAEEAWLAERIDAIRRDYCDPCPVREPCLERGISERYGVWAGTLPSERRVLIRERKSA